MQNKTATICSLFTCTRRRVMNHEHNKYSGYGISSDELHIIMHLPRERREPLYSKLHDAKMMKTSTGKKISVIVRLPKT